MIRQKNEHKPVLGITLSNIELFSSWNQRWPPKCGIFSRNFSFNKYMPKVSKLFLSIRIPQPSIQRYVFPQRGKNDLSNIQPLIFTKFLTTNKHVHWHLVWGVEVGSFGKWCVWISTKKVLLFWEFSSNQDSDNVNYIKEFQLYTQKAVKYFLDGIIQTELWGGVWSKFRDLKDLLAILSLLEYPESDAKNMVEDLFLSSPPKVDSYRLS